MQRTSHPTLLRPLRRVGVSRDRSRDAHGSAEPSAIADHSAFPCHHSASNVNGLHVVSFLQWFLPSTVVDSTEDRKETAQMTCKIERHADGQQTTFRLIGYLQAEHLEVLKAQLESHGPRTVLDLDEVTLVDVEVMRFLGGCEAAGIAVLHCPPYIREWIAREQRQ